MVATMVRQTTLIDIAEQIILASTTTIGIVIRETSIFLSDGLELDKIQPETKPIPIAPRAS